MQFMQMLKSGLKPRRSLLATLVLVGVVASVMGLTPTKGASNTLAESCANPPTTPTFNYWPVTYDDTNTPLCHDFPAIDAAIDVNNPQFSTSQADWDDGLTIGNNQDGAVLMYLHNGAANNLPTAQTTARNVKIKTETDLTVGPTHQIKVTYTADNAPTYTRSFTVKTPANSKLEVLPNSGFMYDYEGRIITDQQNLNIGNSTFDLGRLDACFEYSIFLSFKFKVVPQTPPNPTNTTLSIEKKVKNLTVDPNTGRGAVYFDSVNAKQNEQVGYRIEVINTGTSVARNVTVTDPGVAGVTANSGSTTVGVADDSEIGSGWSGSLPGTVNLGDLQPGEVRLVKYTGRVTVPSGTLVNTAKAIATNAPQVQDSATVIVTTINPGNPNLTISKLVKNNNQNTAFADSVDAKTNEWVRFKVTITNTGNADLVNAVVTDAIPAGLQFENTAVANDGTISFVNGTLRVVYNGTIPAGQSRTLEFNAQVVATGPTTICNIASATASNVAQVQDNACVNVAPPIVVGTPNLTISKLVKNNNQNTAFADSVDAKTNEWVRFKVTITNTGNADLVNARITDTIPTGLEFENTAVANDGTISFSNGVLTVVYNGVIPAGHTRVLEFNALVKSNGPTTICNVAKATGNSVSEVQDNACVKVIAPPVVTNPKIAIKKFVKNISTSGNYEDSSVDARTGERVGFKVTVTNTGDTTLNSVRITDIIPAGFEYDANVSGDGTANFANTTFTVDLGSLTAGQSKTVEFTAKVLATGPTTICNIAKANASGVSEVQDDACVKVYTTPKPGDANIVLSKKAFNETKGVDATTVSAARGDYITYTLITTNNGTADKTNYVITDDLSQVLSLVDVVSLNGGTLSGNTLSYPSMTIKAGETVTKTFKVRIKQTLSAELTYQLKNTYGNTVIINVPGKIVYVAPKTGAAATSAGIFAGLLTAGFVIARKRDSILKLIWA